MLPYTFAKLHHLRGPIWNNGVVIDKVNQVVQDFIDSSISGSNLRGKDMCSWLLQRGGWKSDQRPDPAWYKVPLCVSENPAIINIKVWVSEWVWVKNVFGGYDIIEFGECLSDRCSITWWLVGQKPAPQDSKMILISNYVSGHNWGVHLVALNEGPDFRQRGTYGESRPRLNRYISIHVVLKTRSCAFNLRSN